MDKLIYLDWNVFQDIFQKRRYLELEEILIDWKRRKNYKVVFSSSHMSDLYKCSDPNYIKSDLLSLSKITEDYCMGLDGDNIAIQKINPNIVFQEISDSIKNEKVDISGLEVKFNFSTYKVDVTKLSQNNIIIPYLESGNICSPSSLENLVKDLIANDIFTNHNIQKSFRVSLKECVEANNPAFASIVDFQVYKYLLSGKEEIKLHLREIIDAFLSISGKKFNSIPLGEQITTSYRMLDFFPAFSEKLDRRNNQRNICIDSEHLFWASKSRYLVCGDNNMIEKAKLIYTLTGVSTKVKSPIDFINML